MASEAHLVSATLAGSLLSDGAEIASVEGITVPPRRSSVIAFVGMNFEARIAAGPGVLVFTRNSRKELVTAVENASRHGCRGIVSFGVAGGLAADLRPGDLIVASAILDGRTVRHTDRTWATNLLTAIDGANYAPLLGVDAPVADPARKRELHRTTGAVAVDMESHVVARLSAEHRLAFAAVRVVVDPAHRPIPPAALLGMAADGRADAAAILRDVMVRPSQLLQLIRVAADAFTARSELLRARRLLGPHFALTEVAKPEVTRYVSPA